MAYCEDLRSLFALGRRLAAAGQQAILASSVDLAVELAQRTGLRVVVSDACQGEPIAQIERLAEQLLERIRGVRLVFQVPDGITYANRNEASDSIFTFATNGSPARVKAVVDMATLADGVTGPSDQIDLMDFLQLLLMKCSSGALAVQGSETTGLIVVVDGEIVDASCGGLRGDEAVLEMLLRRPGRFQEVPLPRTVERTIEGRSDSLLFEAIRLRDARDASRVAPAGVTHGG